MKAQAAVGYGKECLVLLIEYVRNIVRRNSPMFISSEDEEVKTGMSSPCRTECLPFRKEICSG